MQSAKSSVKDANDFLRRIKELKKLKTRWFHFSKNWCCRSLSEYTTWNSVDALSERLETLQGKKIAKEGLLKKTKFVLKNNFFDINSKIKQQISGTAIDTKFAPPYACIFMDKVETKFLDKIFLKLRFWLRYMDAYLFLYGLMVKKVCKSF